jgi:hypothetical protein
MAKWIRQETATKDAAINPGTEMVGSQENDADECSVGACSVPSHDSPRRELGAPHL